MNALGGKIAVVTGASRGLGKAIAEGLVNQGAHVVLTSRNQVALDDTAREITSQGGKATAIAGDMRNPSNISSFFEEVRRRLGRVDILVNNAGTTVTKKAFDVTEEDWDTVLNTNLKGLFFASRAAGRLMKEQGGGKIVNMASVMGAVGDLSISPYVASKGGVIQLTKALALEWARYNIQVNGVGPGYVKTDMNRETLEANEKARNHILGKIPMRRLGQADEIASAVLYLCSEQAAYITGQTLFIDGGWLAQ